MGMDMVAGFNVTRRKTNDLSVAQDGLASMDIYGCHFMRGWNRRSGDQSIEFNEMRSGSDIRSRDNDVIPSVQPYYR
jgi:hypothetical protein